MQSRVVNGPKRAHPSTISTSDCLFLMTSKQEPTISPQNGSCEEESMAGLEAICCEKTKAPMTKQPSGRCTVFVGLLLIALHHANAAQMFCANTGERKSNSGMIASFFGGIKDTFQSGMNSSMEKNSMGPFFKGSFGAGKEGKVNSNGSHYARELEGQQAILINTGGPNYTNPDGFTWVTDSSFFTDGKTYSKTAAISNTKDTLYQSEHYASEMRYDMDLPNGEYSMFLHFVEIYAPAFVEGKHRFICGG